MQKQIPFNRRKVSDKSVEMFIMLGLISFLFIWLLSTSQKKERNSYTRYNRFGTKTKQSADESRGKRRNPVKLGTTSSVLLFVCFFVFGLTFTAGGRCRPGGQHGHDHQDGSWAMHLDR